jgi:hypothetical protein
MHVDKIVYDSDSEDEDGYEYPDDRPLYFDEKNIEDNCTAVVLFRGIHFSPSIFNKEERSKARRLREDGMTIFSLVSYDRSKLKCTSRYGKGESKDLFEISKNIRSKIIKFGDKRHNFQSAYINKFNKFLERFKGNPLISTSEVFQPGAKYAFGKIVSVPDGKRLKPEYDKNGKPKHPYLGKIYVILVATDDAEKLGAYFVACEHNSKRIKVSSFYAKNYLAAREVSFPGFIPGNCVVFEKPVRVPSFSGSYRKYYEKKYGITKRSFKIIKTKLTAKKPDQTDKEFAEKRLTAVDNFIKKIIQHNAKKLKNHIEEECKKNKISIVYKSFNDGFVSELPKL